jgi:hypothetical protein
LFRELTAPDGTSELTAGSTEGVADVLRRLLRREILEQTDGGYRFQIEMVRRWFATRRPVISP